MIGSKSNPYPLSEWKMDNYIRHLKERNRNEINRLTSDIKKMAKEIVNLQR